MLEKKAVSISKPAEQSWAQQATDKIYDYTYGTWNTSVLLWSHAASTNSNAYHDYMNQLFLNKNNNPSIAYLPVTQPQLKSGYPMFCQRVVIILDPLIRQAVLKIPREETLDNTSDNKPISFPKIHGGRAFGEILDAIGMGILSKPAAIHQPFSLQMIHTLSIPKIDASRSGYKIKPLTDNVVLKKGFFYVRKNKQGIEYAVITPDSQSVKNIILEKDLPCNIQDLTTRKDFENILSDLLKITKARADTKAFNWMNTEELFAMSSRKKRIKSLNYLKKPQ